MKIISDAINESLDNLGLEKVRFAVEHPIEESHGDYAVNVAMILAKQMKQNPKELAEKIKGKLGENTELTEMMEKIEVAGAGFINFFFKKEWLKKQLSEVVVQGKKYGSNGDLEGKRVMVEYTDPNPFKEFHIGHLMTNTIGESLARLFSYSGAEVYKANYQGDVGLHVAKSIWGLMNKMSEGKITLDDMSSWDLKKRVNYLGQSYALGAMRYEDETIKTKIDDLNKKIYEKSDPELNKLYEVGRKWSLEYFETIYERLGTKFDGYYFESETGKVGLEVVKEGLEKGVFEESKGAIVFLGEKHGLHTRVFRNSLGLPTYEAKDLGLAKEKYEKWEYDQSFIVTANEIDEYFRVVLKAMSMLYPDLAKKTVHLGHGMMKFPEGKMSSRTGNVVTGEGLINSLKEDVLKIMGDREVDDREATADKIAVGAIKYMILKHGIGGDIIYDKERAVSFEGDSGPYLQYTYARCQSVLGKADVPMQSGLSPKPELIEDDKAGLESVPALSKEEMAVLRWLYRFSEVVEEAAREFAPNKVCSYLYELASRYNGFYNKHRVIGSGESEQFRLLLTKSVEQVMENGLGLLGVEAPAKM